MKILNFILENAKNMGFFLQTELKSGFYILLAVVIKGFFISIFFFRNSKQNCFLASCG